MEIHLPPAIEERLKEIVERYNYDSPDQAIAHSINVLEYWDELQDAQVEEHRKLVQEALDGSPAIPGEEVFAGLESEAPSVSRKQSERVPYQCQGGAGS